MDVMRRLGLVLLAGCCMAAAPMAARPLSRMDLPWWRQRFDEKQAELKANPPQIIFLGDSITQNWERSGPEAWRNFQPIWQHYYGARHAINLGFKGDATSHLLWRMDNGELDHIAPRVAVVLIGANNFGHVHWDASETLTGIDAILSDLQRRLPNTKILLLSVLPSQRSAWISQQTELVNRALPSHAAAHGAAYVDLTPVFAPNGKLDRSLYLDDKLTPSDPLLHPSAEGQARMAAAMEPTLDRLMKP